MIFEWLCYSDIKNTGHPWVVLLVRKVFSAHCPSPTNHSQKLSFISAVLIRSRGFTRTSLSITCLAFSEMSLWMYSKCPFLIFSNRSL